MNCIKQLFTALFVLAMCCRLSAQNNDDARALIKEGLQLNNEKKYAQAIEKYRLALKSDTGNLFAGYQLANSLFLSDKGAEGIPYLKKITQTDNKLKGAAYDLLGLIYFKNKQYSEAEAAAIAAIKIDPKHAGTQRMYALVSFHQNKRAQAFLGFCSFILLEPNNARSAEAYGNMLHIIQGGNLKPGPGEIQSHAMESDVNALNQAITQAVADFSKRRYSSAGDLLTAEMTAIFTNIGKLAEKQTGNDFFRNYLAAYFYKLAQSPNMPAFARLVSSSTPESGKWIKEHPQQMADLDNWVKDTGRTF
ncbi:tetratricopeptide repeat protein [Mucilaginibacter sp. L3T2-6]|uniref:tetratricopeptide repeat protein n=1 Tax=Mucilaginibacter sp. L3T2-6 TaxID=3062491 RepID=UPI002676AF45|nr:tetratricopeptide repeat protein [Mucilaginibacter sp. L3T2-6]MDO3643558.1 tetratricopeptide repeat protein [Mucilaginibacter sp. L3T2-6]MDV6216009.1 tetratricopeptide repeat protein [Mucilaginibacter sp. L3T2-6]